MTPAASSTQSRWSRWVNTWTTLSLSAVIAAMLVWGPGNVAFIATVVAAPFALVLIVLRYSYDEWDNPPEHTTGLGWMGRVLACGTTLVVAIIAVAGLSLGIAFLVVLLAVATSPPVIERRRRVLGQSDVEAAAGAATPSVELPQPSPGWSAQHVQTLSDVELCRAWRLSFWMLHEAARPHEKAQIVEHRQCLLDELEHRDSVALEAWLASGARASGGPEQFFGTEGGDRPTAA